MDFTGERPTEESGSEGSLMRYHSILPWCLNKGILDYGCGIGIGSRYLSKYSSGIIGYEPNKEACEEARKLTNASNVQFIDEIDFNKIFNVKICCMVEVIEHIEKPDLEELLKVVPFDIIGTTPNGNLFPYHPMTVSERRGFHVWHYTYQELYDLLSKFYSYVEVYGAIWDPKIGAFTSLNFYGSNDTF